MGGEGELDGLEESHLQREPGLRGAADVPDRAVHDVEQTGELGQVGLAGELDDHLLLDLGQLAGRLAGGPGHQDVPELERELLGQTPEVGAAAA